MTILFVLLRNCIQRPPPTPPHMAADAPGLSREPSQFNFGPLGICHEAHRLRTNKSLGKTYESNFPSRGQKENNILSGYNAQLFTSERKTTGR